MRSSTNPELYGSEFNQLSILYKEIEWRIPRNASEYFNAKRNGTERVCSEFGVERDKTIDVTALLASSSYSARNRLTLGYTSATAVLIR